MLLKPAYVAPKEMFGSITDIPLVNHNHSLWTIHSLASNHSQYTKGSSLPLIKVQIVYGYKKDDIVCCKESQLGLGSQEPGRAVAVFYRPGARYHGVLKTADAGGKVV